MPRLPPAFHRIQQQGQPDKNERHQRSRVQGFPKHEYAEKERAGRGNVLQQAKRHQAHMPGGIGEHETSGKDVTGPARNNKKPSRTVGLQRKPSPFQ